MSNSLDLRKQCPFLVPIYLPNFITFSFQTICLLLCPIRDIIKDRLCTNDRNVREIRQSPYFLGDIAPDSLGMSRWLSPTCAAKFILDEIRLKLRVILVMKTFFSKNLICNLTEDSFARRWHRHAIQGIAILFQSTCSALIRCVRTALVGIDIRRRLLLSEGWQEWKANVLTRLELSYWP